MCLCSWRNQYNYAKIVLHIHTSRAGQHFSTKCCSYEWHMAYWNDMNVLCFCVHHMRIQNVPLNVEPAKTACHSSNERATRKWVFVAVPKLHASRSQQNHTTLQYKQQSWDKWRQLRTRAIAKLAMLYCWLTSSAERGVIMWPCSMQFGDRY
jgi:hypothetical protein